MRLIDADALMDELENEQPFNWTDSPGEIQEQADWERFKGMVSVAHTIEAEPVRHGRWEIVIGSNGKEYMVCTVCRKQQDLTGVFSYCPNCGAKMDKEE